MTLEQAAEYGWKHADWSLANVLIGIGECNEAKSAAIEQQPNLAAIREVIHELSTYNPLADEYKGIHVHTYWSNKLTRAIGDKP